MAWSRQDDSPQRRWRRRPRGCDRHHRRRCVRSRYLERRRGRRGASRGMPPQKKCWQAATGSRSRARLWPKAVRDHASAAMDVSDGLAGDLAKLCTASGVSAAIDAQSIPLSAAAQALLTRGAVGIESIVSGGDDYEILCTIPENRFEAFEQAAKLAGVAVTSIGTIIAGTARPQVPRRSGQPEISVSAPVLEPFLRFSQKVSIAAVSPRFLSKIDRLGRPRRCAGGAILAWSRRFEAALWAGQASFLCARRTCGDGVG